MMSSTALLINNLICACKFAHHFVCLFLYDVVYCTTDKHFNMCQEIRRPFLFVFLYDVLYCTTDKHFNMCQQIRPPFLFVFLYDVLNCTADKHFNMCQQIHPPFFFFIYIMSCTALLINTLICASKFERHLCLFFFV